MKALSVVLAILLGIGGIATAFWLGNRQPQAGPHSHVEENVSEEDFGPKISPTEPHPKAVIAETEYNFGAMMIGGKGTHPFKIRNEGAAPLELAVGKRTCQCTAANLSSDQPIPPGGEVVIELTWEIKAKVSKFRHSAKIHTNDPEHKIIELVILGDLEAEYHIEPGAVVDLGEATSENPLSAEGAIFSRARDHFEIAGATFSHPRVTCVWTPLDTAELTRRDAKSGYQLTFQLNPQGVTGTINESVVLNSSDRDENGAPLPLARIGVKLKNPGLVEIIGRNWDPDQNRLSLGEFPAGEGKRAELSVYIRMDEDVRFLAAEPDKGEIKFAWEKDEKFQSKSGGKQRYKLSVQVLPGPALNRQRGQAEKMDLKFDHPKVGYMQLKVDYLSL